MRRPERKFRPFFHLESSASQEEDAELDLLLLMDAVNPGNVGLAEKLVAMYGGELYRLAAA